MEEINAKILNEKITANKPNEIYCCQHTKEKKNIANTRRKHYWQQTK